MEQETKALASNEMLKMLDKEAPGKGEGGCNININREKYIDRKQELCRN